MLNFIAKSRVPYRALLMNQQVGRSQQIKYSSHPSLSFIQLSSRNFLKKGQNEAGNDQDSDQPFVRPKYVPKSQRGDGYKGPKPEEDYDGDNYPVRRAKNHRPPQEEKIHPEIAKYRLTDVYKSYSQKDLNAFKQQKLQQYLEGLSQEERKKFEERNALLFKNKPVLNARQASKQLKEQEKLKKESFEKYQKQLKEFKKEYQKQKNELSYSNHSQLMGYKRKMEKYFGDKKDLKIEAEKEAHQKALDADYSTVERIQDTFSELNRRLMTYQKSNNNQKDKDLELFQAEKQALYQSVFNQNEYLNKSHWGSQIRELKKLQEKYDRNGSQWSKEDIDAFISEYLAIYANYVIPKSNKEDIKIIINKPKVIDSTISTKNLLWDFTSISQTLKKQMYKDLQSTRKTQDSVKPKSQKGVFGNVEFKEGFEVSLDVNFFRKIRQAIVDQKNSDPNGQVNLDINDFNLISEIVEDYLQNLGYMPYGPTEQLFINQILGIGPQLEIDQESGDIVFMEESDQEFDSIPDVQKAFLNQEIEKIEAGTGSSEEKDQKINELIDCYSQEFDSSIQPKYQNYLQDILQKLNLSENKRFLVFLIDIAINTVDLREPEVKFSHVKEVIPESEQELEQMQDNQYYKPKEEISDKFNLRNAEGTCADVYIKLPVIEKFIDLLLSLHKPDFYLDINYMKTKFVNEISLLCDHDKQGTAQKIIQDPEIMLKYQVVSLAKMHNFFGGMDEYMREFARICVETGNKQVISNLERVLNSEVAIEKEQIESKILGISDKLDVEIDPRVLAQPQFQFSAVPYKLQDIKNYQDLVKDQEMTRQAIRMLQTASEDHKTFNKLTSDFSQLFKMINELDSQNQTYNMIIDGKIGTFEKLKKTSEAINQQMTSSFLNIYGINGITFSNLEQVYSPTFSGLGSMQKVREHLLSRGMTPNFADLLAAKYIKKIEETSEIFKLMDFFSTNSNGFKAMRSLCEVDLNSIYLNYQTLKQYQQSLYSSHFNKTVFMTPKITSLAGPVGASPIRPLPVAPHRYFSSKPENEQSSSGRFFDFLKDIAKTKKPVEETSVKVDTQEKLLEDETQAAQKAVEQAVEPTDNQTVEQPTEQMEEQTVQNEVGIQEQKQPKQQLTQEQLELIARNKFYREAIQKYNTEFFKQYAFSGMNGLKLSQKSLEQFIISQDDPNEVNLLLVSMIKQAYPLNVIIPNIELLLCKMFCSPITTKELRREANDQVKPLVGNIFADKKMSLHPDVYRSMLQTLTMRPNKKHYKKILEYVRKNEKKENISPVLLDQIISVGIDQQYPITLGKFIRDIIVQEDYNIHKTSFMKFLMFLERSKGYEEDAKKFLILLQYSSHLQIDYELMAPYIKRVIKNKGGTEIIKFFDQIRKNIKLNQSWEDKPAGERSVAEKIIRKGFFDGMIADLMSSNYFSMAQIVMDEKNKEKFEVSLEDEMVAMQIHAKLLNMEIYKEKFLLFFDTDVGPKQYELTADLATILSKTLLNFEEDKYKNDKLMLMERLNKKMQSENILFNEDVFHNLCNVYVEAQQWEDVANFLRYHTDAGFCSPNQRTMKYLKSNIAYIFVNNVRIDLQDAIQKFEYKYFSLDAIRRAKEQAQGDQQQKKITAFGN